MPIWQKFEIKGPTKRNIVFGKRLVIIVARESACWGDTAMGRQWHQKSRFCRLSIYASNL